MCVHTWFCRMNTSVVFGLIQFSINHVCLKFSFLFPHITTVMIIILLVVSIRSTIGRTYGENWSNPLRYASGNARQNVKRKKDSQVRLRPRVCRAILDLRLRLPLPLRTFHRFVLKPDKIDEEDGERREGGRGRRKRKGARLQGTEGAKLN